MIEKGLISIVIPIFKVEKYIRECLVLTSDFAIGSDVWFRCFVLLFASAAWS